MEDDARAALEGDEASARLAASWQPPAGLPPLPAKYRARVQAVLATQRRALAQVHERMDAVRAELSAARNTAPVAASAPPVYLDTLG